MHAEHCVPRGFRVKGLDRLNSYPFCVLPEVGTVWSAHIWSLRKMTMKGPSLFILVILWYLKATSDTYIHGFLLIWWFLAVTKNIHTDEFHVKARGFKCHSYLVCVTLTCDYVEGFSYHLCSDPWVLKQRLSCLQIINNYVLNFDKYQNHLEVGRLAERVGTCSKKVTGGINHRCHLLSSPLPCPDF